MKPQNRGRTWKDVTTPKQAPERSNGLFLWVFSVAMVVTAGTAFVFKLIEFVYTAVNNGPGALTSFLIPVLNYLLVAAGFGCLFLWAYVTGQFRNVEAPKHRMLELEREWDRIESAGDVQRAPKRSRHE